MGTSWVIFYIPMAEPQVTFEVPDRRREISGERKLSRSAIAAERFPGRGNLRGPRSLPRISAERMNSKVIFFGAAFGGAFVGQPIPIIAQRKAVRN